MSVIRITVSDQDLVCTECPVIAAQGVNEDTVAFTFSDEWNGLGKTALFFNGEDREKIYTSIVDANGVASVPWEATADDGNMWIGVYGVAGNVIYTSNLLRYKIEKGIYTPGSQSEPPTPGIYEQIMSMIGSTIGTVTEMIQTEADARTEADTTLSNRIAANASRIDGIVDAFNVESVEATLFTGQARYTGTAYTLSEAVTAFDYLDIYTDFYGKKAIQRIPALESTNFDITGFNLSDYSSESGAGTHPMIEGGEIKISFSGTTMTVVNHAYYRYNKDTSGDPIGGNLTSSATDAIKLVAGWIYKIVGHKASQNTELVDARVGYDGTTYDNAGDAIRGQAAGLADRVDKATGGTVNLLPYPYASGGAVEPYTHNGITYTVNPDGSITANGTANGVSRFYVARRLQLVYDATYWLSGCPEGGSSGTYRLRCDAANSTGTYVEDVGSGKQVTPSTEDRALRNVFIVITSGTTVENVTFYPMLQNYDDGVIEEYITPATAKDAQARAVLSDTKAKVDALGFASMTLLEDGDVLVDFGGEP